jgi:hypothetical protein
MALTNLGLLSGALLAPLQARGAGTATFGPETFPAGFTFLALAFDLRNVVSLTLVLSATVQYSIDGGATFLSLSGGGIDLAQSGYTFDGAVLRNLEGGPVRSAMFFRQIPRSDISRVVQVVLTQSEAATASALAFAW